MNHHIHSAQVAARDALMHRVCDELSGDDDVAALWLAGSLAYGGDALSDIDLIAVAATGFEQKFLSNISAHMSSAANPVLIHSAPQNAPSGGGHFNALYDMSPLPIFIDWNIWPATAASARPCDVAILFERDDMFSAGTKTVAETLVDVEMGRAHPSTTERRRQFRQMMVPVIAKYAARGRFEQVAALFELISVPGPGEPDLQTVLRVLERVLGNQQESQNVDADSCIRRYLRTLGSVSQDWSSNH